MTAEVFDELWQVICERAESKSLEKSYVRHLLFHEKGIDKPLEKVGEESCEFVLAVKNGREEAIVREAAGSAVSSDGCPQSCGRGLCKGGGGT